MYNSPHPPTLLVLSFYLLISIQDIQLSRFISDTLVYRRINTKLIRIIRQLLLTSFRRTERPQPVIIILIIANLQVVNIYRWHVEKRVGLPLACGEEKDETIRCCTSFNLQFNVVSTWVKVSVYWSGYFIATQSAVYEIRNLFIRNNSIVLEYPPIQPPLFCYQVPITIRSPTSLAIAVK